MGGRKSFSRTPLKSPPPERRAACLSPNDDQVERARARRARRKSFIQKPDGAEEEEERPGALSNQQITDLYASCIKLATENVSGGGGGGRVQVGRVSRGRGVWCEQKINQRNTWGLGLIDHMASIIQLYDEEEETNFQKASCTLDAGVKIYSTRVDSVHSETFKVLGGLHRTEGKGEEGRDEADKEESAKQNAREKRRQKRVWRQVVGMLVCGASSFVCVCAAECDADLGELVGGDQREKVGRVYKRSRPALPQNVSAV